MRRVLQLFLLSCCFAPAASAQYREDRVYGTQVHVQTRILGPSVAGELLAVSHDSLWMLDGLRLAAFPLREVAQVRIDRSTPGPGLAWAWALIGGAVTGAALTAACSSIGGNSGCGRVLLPVSIGLFALPGAIAAASLAHSRYETLESPVPVDLLRPRARFPQGLPPGVSRDSVAVPR